jgi:hypothetical protein
MMEDACTLLITLIPLHTSVFLPSSRRKRRETLLMDPRNSSDLEQRLDQLLQLIVSQHQQLIEWLQRVQEAQTLSVTKDGYTVEDIAERMKRKPWTVRQWCNTGRVQAKKVQGKGRRGEWRISPEEFSRLQREGIRPRGTFTRRAA